MTNTSAEPADGQVEEDLFAALPWSWRWPGGRILRFDRAGRLARIEAPDLDRIELRRNEAGRLVLLVQRGYAAERIAFDLD